MGMLVLVAGRGPGSVHTAQGEHSKWHHPRGHGCAGKMRDARKTCASPLGAGTWSEGGGKRPEEAVPPFESPCSP